MTDSEHMRAAKDHLSAALEHIMQTKWHDAPSTDRLSTMVESIGNAIAADQAQEPSSDEVTP